MLKQLTASKLQLDDMSDYYSDNKSENPAQVKSDLIYEKHVKSKNDCNTDPPEFSGKGK